MAASSWLYYDTSLAFRAEVYRSQAGARSDAVVRDARRTPEQRYVAAMASLGDAPWHPPATAKRAVDERPVRRSGSRPRPGSAAPRGCRRCSRRRGVDSGGSGSAAAARCGVETCHVGVAEAHLVRERDVRKPGVLLVEIHERRIELAAREQRLIGLQHLTRVVVVAEDPFLEARRFRRWRVALPRASSERRPIAVAAGPTSTGSWRASSGGSTWNRVLY
jgi:hypothetical protein